MRVSKSNFFLKRLGWGKLPFTGMLKGAKKYASNGRMKRAHQLKCMADKIAQYFLIQSYESGMEYDPWTATQAWLVLVEVNPHPLDMGPVIRDTLYIPQFKEYLDEKVN